MQTGLVFDSILCDSDKFAVHGSLCYHMPDCDRISIVVNGTPFQPDYLITP